MICPFCKEEIMDGSIKCKHCKSMLASIEAQNVRADSSNSIKSPIWTSVTSLTLGGLAALTGLTTEWYDEDTANGMLFLGGVAIVLGIISVNKEHRGRRMAIGGIVAGAIAVLSFFSIDWGHRL
ncbi:hypothetical protein [Desulfovibrio cuneatus]|uniref:hypothetical protein n=1 Tax=Desulfovibrio cuneatus TaxID=159728 RepID=UPI00048627E0|nr:hypothetical protein [Desulfovibrio cuneatus]